MLVFPCHMFLRFPQELERSRAGLKQAQAEVDKLKGDLDKKTMEIISLKRSNQELDAEQKYEIERLKDKSRKDREELTKVHEKTKQVKLNSRVGDASFPTLFFIVNINFMVSHFNRT